MLNRSCSRAALGKSVGFGDVPAHGFVTVVYEVPGQRAHPKRRISLACTTAGDVKGALEIRTLRVVFTAPQFDHGGDVSDFWLHDLMLRKRFVAVKVIWRGLFYTSPLRSTLRT